MTMASRKKKKELKNLLKKYSNSPMKRILVMQELTRDKGLASYLGTNNLFERMESNEAVNLNLLLSIYSTIKKIYNCIGPEQENKVIINEYQIILDNHISKLSEEYREKIIKNVCLEDLLERVVNEIKNYKINSIKLKSLSKKILKKVISKNLDKRFFYSQGNVTKADLLVKILEGYIDGNYEPHEILNEFENRLYRRIESVYNSQIFPNIKEMKESVKEYIRDKLENDGISYLIANHIANELIVQMENFFSETKNKIDLIKKANELVKKFKKKYRLIPF